MSPKGTERSLRQHDPVLIELSLVNWQGPAGSSPIGSTPRMRVHILICSSKDHDGTTRPSPLAPRMDGGDPTSDTLNGIRRNTGSVLSRPTGPRRVTSLKLRLRRLPPFREPPHCSVRPIQSPSRPRCRGIWLVAEGGWKAAVCRMSTARQQSTENLETEWHAS
jgi:hypothetical protein